MSNAARNQGTSKFVLRLGTRSIPLELGAILKGDAIGLGGREVLIGRVDPGKEGADELVLRNLSDRNWSVRKADGEQRDVGPEGKVKVEEGRRIDFGGVSGVICLAGVQPVRLDQFVSIEKDAMAVLSRTLVRAVDDKVITQEQFECLHKVFYAYDTQGRGWTFGLQQRQWGRWEPGGWVVDRNPPATLLIDPKTLTELHALQKRLEAMRKK